MVRPEALKKIQGNLAADEGRVSSIEEDFKNGEGLYEPVMVFYDPETGFAFVAEGNHRVQAAINAGEEFIPTIVVTGEVSNKKKGEFTPGKIEKTPGYFYKPEGDKDATTEVNPFFVFPDEDVLSPEEPSGLDQAANDDSEIDSPERVVGKAIAPELIQVGDIVEVKNVPGSMRRNPQVKTRRVIITHKMRGAYMPSDPEAISFIGTTMSPKASNAYPDSRSYTFRLLKERPDWLETAPEPDTQDEPSEEKTPWEFKKRSIEDKNGDQITEGDQVKIAGSELIYTAERIDYNNFGMVQIERDGKKRRVNRFRLLRVDAPSVEPRPRSIYTRRGSITEGDLVYKDFNTRNVYRADRIEDDGTVNLSLQEGRLWQEKSNPMKLIPVDSMTKEEVAAESARMFRIKRGFEQAAPGLDQDVSTLDRISNILDKYRSTPAVPDGSPGSKQSPLELSEEEYSAKGVEISQANKKAASEVWGVLKDLISPSKFVSWKRAFSRDSTRALPINPVSGVAYKGPNLIALEKAAVEKGFSDPRWMTRSQIAEQGGTIRVGVEGTEVLVPTVVESVVNGKPKELFEFKKVVLFNVDQVEGIAPYSPEEKKSYTAKEAAEVLLDRMREAAVYRGDSVPRVFGVQLDPDQNPRWTPNYGTVDRIKLPLRENFKDDEAWFQTLAHELIHSTGKSSRLDREEVTKAIVDKDKDAKAKEELTAEIGSMLLSRMFGVKIDEENSAAYIRSYLSKKDISSKEFSDALARAQVAVDYVLGNDVLPTWDPERTKLPPTEQAIRMNETTPKTSSLNPDPDFAYATGYLEQAAKKPYSPKNGVSSSKNAKEKVLSSLLEKIKEGKSPWRKPFKEGANFAGAFLPRNPASKHVYSGINSIVLKLNQTLSGYDDPRWMTYNQATEMGGQVRKGEKGTPILVPMRSVKKEKDATTGEEKVTGGYISFSSKTVFNVAQIDGLNLPSAEEEAGEPKTPLEAQEFILGRYKISMEAKGLTAPEVDYTYVGAYGSHSSSPNWRPSTDVITLPTKEQFNSPEDMFDTIAHELAHSTGHPTRLDRSELTKNYSTDNAARGKEELIAEISAAILASMFGVNSDFDNTAAYVQSWLGALKDNPEMVMSASSEAQKVVDYLLGMDLGDWSPIDGYTTTVKSKSDGEKDE